MSTFAKGLADRAVDPAGRSWIFVPYDQLGACVGPLEDLEPEKTGLVFVESPWKAARRPVHRQKLALLLANQRHFALEQAERGCAVRHVVADGPFRDALRPLAEELGTLTVAEPAERELRVDLAPLVADGALEVVPHRGWLTTREDFDASHPQGAPWKLDTFYRHVRGRTGLLMEDGRPAGGRWSFDADNRERWRGEPAPPELPRFRPDEVTREVVELVESRFARHPGRVRPEELVATRHQVERLWAWFLEHALEHFGPYQDAMARGRVTLFHSRVAPLVHLHRLAPRRVVEEVAASDAPIASREGFVRQVLGWREFVRHVHRATDGFRDDVPTDDAPGDGGWSAWAGESWRTGDAAPADAVSADAVPADAVPADAVDSDGGATPAALASADLPLPPAYWGERSGLACLDDVVARVLDTGYAHHIERLMVLANLATLFRARPRELTDWFWCAFTDAYDWVVEPNVLAMGSFAVGPTMTTKPYVSGAAYLHRMSDFCGRCAFDPKVDCPLTPAYWALLDREAQVLEESGRMAMPLRSLAKRGDERRAADRARAEAAALLLAAGEELSPTRLDEVTDEELDELRARFSTKRC